jgi:flagellar biosynthesis/type III secretory pathway chaperone
LLATIRQSVLELREQHARNTTLLQRSLELTGQTLQFLQRLTLGQSATYTPAGATGVGHSLVLDGRA